MSWLLPRLTIETGLSRADLLSIARTAPRRYKTYFIPKRSGGRRQIAQPAREVKAIQRAIIEVLLRDLPVDGAAKAYVRGTSIRDNATPHAGGGAILKMDFKDFFPSLRGDDWRIYCGVRGLLGEETDLELSTQFLFRYDPKKRGLRLSIGAPSSPILSNILMVEFDTALRERLGDRVSYTRYADDMTFSAPRLGFLSDIPTAVARTVRELRSPRLDINSGKTTFVTRKNRRVVTGVTLANDGRLTVGRNRKRTISAAVHAASLGRLAPSKLQRLAGDLAFINVVEPDFLDKLRAKYGEAVVTLIQKYVVRTKVED